MYNVQTYGFTVTELNDQEIAISQEEDEMGSHSICLNKCELVLLVQFLNEINGWESSIGCKVIKRSINESLHFRPDHE